MFTHQSINVERIGRGCVRLATAQGMVIYINPRSEIINSTPQDGNIIFVTNEDFDYYAPASIDAVAAESCTIVEHEDIETTDMGRETRRLDHEWMSVDGIEARIVSANRRWRNDPFSTSPNKDVRSAKNTGLLLSIADTALYLPRDAQFLNPEVASKADVLIPLAESHHVSPEWDMSKSNKKRDSDVIFPVRHDTIRTLRHLIRDFEEFESSQRAVQTRLNQNEHAVDELDNDIKTLTEDINSLRDQSATVGGQVLPLSEAIEQLDTLVSRAANKESVYEEIERLEEQVEEVTQAHDESIAAVESTVDGLKSEIKAHKRASQMSISELNEDVERINRKLSERISEIETNFTSVERAIERLQVEFESLDRTTQKEVDNLLPKIVDPQPEVHTAEQELNQQVKKAVSDCNTKTNEHQLQEEVRNNLEEIQQIKDRVSKLNDKYESDMADVQSDIQQLREQQVSLNGNSVPIDVAVEELSTKIGEMQSKVSEMTNFQQEIDSVQEDFEEISETVDRLSDRVGEVEAKNIEVETLANEFDTIDEESLAVSRVILRLLNSVEKITNPLNGHGLELDEIEGALSQIESEIDAVEPTHAEAERLWGSLQRLEETRGVQSKKESDSDADLHRLSKQLSELRAKMN